MHRIESRYYILKTEKHFLQTRSFDEANTGSLRLKQDRKTGWLPSPFFAWNRLP